MAVKVDSDKCTGCTACVETCPVEALEMDADGAIVVVDEDKCIDCGVCVGACPTEALEM